MKRIFLPAALLLASTAAFAQQAPAPIERPDQTAAAPAHKPHNPHKEAMRISRQLNLTPDQTAKLEPVLATREQKMSDLDANTALTPKDRHKQKRAIQQDAQAQLSGFLTPDQIEQMKSMHKDGKKHQGVPMTPPSA